MIVPGTKIIHQSLVLDNEYHAVIVRKPYTEDGFELLILFRGHYYNEKEMQDTFMVNDVIKERFAYFYKSIEEINKKPQKEKRSLIQKFKSLWNS
jgi:hypothetical protein